MPCDGVFPTDLGGYGTVGAVEDGAGDDGYRLWTHGFGPGGGVDVLRAAALGIVGCGAVGGDFVTPVVIGGVEFLPYVDGLRPMGPTIVAEPDGHVKVHLPQGAVAFGAEVESVHVGVKERGTLVERGVDGRSQFEGFAPVPVAVEERGVEVDRGVGFAVGAARGSPQHEAAVGGDGGVGLPGAAVDEVGQSVVFPSVGCAVGSVEQSILEKEQGGAVGGDGYGGFVAVGVAEIHLDGGRAPFAAFAAGEEDIFASDVVGSVFGGKVEGVAVGTDDGGILIAFGAVDGGANRCCFGRALRGCLQGGEEAVVFVAVGKVVGIELGSVGGSVPPMVVEVVFEDLL